MMIPVWGIMNDKMDILGPFWIDRLEIYALEPRIDKRAPDKDVGYWVRTRHGRDYLIATKDAQKYLELPELGDKPPMGFGSAQWCAES